jgi:hypothetical protein
MTLIYWAKEEPEDMLVDSTEIYLGKCAERTKMIKAFREQNVRRKAKYHL